MIRTQTVPRPVARSGREGDSNESSHLRPDRFSLEILGRFPATPPQMGSPGTKSLGPKSPGEKYEADLSQSRDGHCGNPPIHFVARWFKTSA